MRLLLNANQWSKKLQISPPPSFFTVLPSLFVVVDFGYLLILGFLPSRGSPSPFWGDLLGALFYGIISSFVFGIAAFGSALSPEGLLADTFCFSIVIYGAAWPFQLERCPLLCRKCFRKSFWEPGAGCL